MNRECEALVMHSFFFLPVVFPRRSRFPFLRRCGGEYGVRGMPGEITRQTRYSVLVARNVIDSGQLGARRCRLFSANGKPQAGVVRVGERGRLDWMDGIDSGPHTLITVCVCAVPVEGSRLWGRIEGVRIEHEGERLQGCCWGCLVQMSLGRKCM